MYNDFVNLFILWFISEGKRSISICICKVCKVQVSKYLESISPLPLELYKGERSQEWNNMQNLGSFSI